MSAADDPFPSWFLALEARHRRTLSFQEIRRALQALSSLYVERRRRLGSGAALDGAGKRAAFALYYGALHFLTVRAVVRALGLARPARIVDLGCGTGVAGAAWAVEAGGRPSVDGVERNAWAAGETRWTLASLRLRGRVRIGDLAAADLPGRGDAVITAFTLNELDEGARATLQPRLLACGAQVLLVEPLARRVAPWWTGWASSFAVSGGRADEWRFPAELPEGLRALDRAAGLDHRELTARSLWLPDRSGTAVARS